MLKRIISFVMLFALLTCTVLPCLAYADGESGEEIVATGGQEEVQGNDNENIIEDNHGQDETPPPADGAVLMSENDEITPQPTVTDDDTNDVNNGNDTENNNVADGNLNNNDNNSGDDIIPGDNNENNDNTNDSDNLNPDENPSNDGDCTNNTGDGETGDDNDSSEIINENGDGNNDGEGDSSDVPMLGAAKDGEDNGGEAVDEEAVEEEMDEEEEEATRGAASDDFEISMVYLDSRVGTTPQVAPYNFTSDKLTGTVTLQVNLLGDEISNTYEPGELEIKVYGLEKFGLKNVRINGSVFNYEHHAGTFNPETRQIEDDYYIIRNKAKIEENTNINAFTQFVYTYGNSSNGCPFNDCSGTVHAELDEELSNELQFEFHIGKQEYTIGGNDNQFDIVSTDGFGADADNYYWMRTGYQSPGIVSPNKPMIVHNPSQLYMVSGVPSNYRVFILDYNGGGLKELNWSDEYNAFYTNSISTGYIVIGAPKDSATVGDVIDFELSRTGQYYYKYNDKNYLEDSEVLVSKPLSLTVKDTIAGNPGDFTSFGVGISSGYTISNIMTDTKNMFAGFGHTVNRTIPYKVIFGLDGIYTLTAENEYYLLDESEYHITGLNNLPKFYNANQLRVGETHSLYVRHRGSSEYVLYGEGYQAGKSITFTDTDIVAVYSVSSSIDVKISGNSSSQALNCKISFDAVPEGYEAGGYICCFGFLDILDATTDQSLLAMTEGEYVSIPRYQDLRIMGIPSADLAKYGKYLYRNLSRTQVKADKYVGFIGVTDDLVGDYTGYSDFYLTTYIGYGTSSTEMTAKSITGYEVYVVLPEQLTFTATASEIKNHLLSQEYSNFLSREGTSSQYGIARFAQESSQFSNVNELIEFVYNSLSVSISHANDKTILKFKFQFPEPLVTTTRAAGTFAEIRFPVRVYDTDIIDYGQDIELLAYGQPALDSSIIFNDSSYNYGVPSGVYSNQIINPNNRATSSFAHGRTWPDTIDIDGDGDTTERFNEFKSRAIYAKPLEAIQEVTLLTKVNGSSFTVKPKTTNADSIYTYRLRIRTAATGMTNLVMYEKLEQYLPDGVENSWHGTLENIDLSRVTHGGYAPTVYYSTSANPDKLGEDSSWTLYDDSVDKSTVKSLAFDFGDHIIPPNHIVSVDINVRAPGEASDYYAYNDYSAEWNRVNPVDNSIIPGDESLPSNITIIAVENQVDENRSITIDKIWDDNNNERGFRPESITVNLFKDGSLLQQVTITATDNWEKTVSGLPWFKEDGSEYTYTITEEAVDKYVSTVDGLTVTNTVVPNKDIEVIKVDSATGNPLSGARLQVLNSDGEIVDDWTSDGTVHIVEQLALGESYRIHEVSAPNGYFVRKDITFRIDDSGDIYITSSSDAIGRKVDNIVVHNYKQVVLPATGSNTSIYLMIIGILVMFAGFMFIIINNRKTKQLTEEP